MRVVGSTAIKHFYFAAFWPALLHWNWPAVKLFYFRDHSIFVIQCLPCRNTKHVENKCNMHKMENLKNIEWKTCLWLKAMHCAWGSKENGNEEYFVKWVPHHSFSWRSNYFRQKPTPAEGFIMESVSIQHKSIKHGETSWTLSSKLDLRYLGEEDLFCPHAKFQD